MSTDIISRIESAIPKLSAKQKTIAVAILQDPLSASFLSAKELSDRINVSPATIVRFAQFITDSGFPQLQTELHEHMQTISNPIKRMKLSTGADSEDSALLGRVFETQTNNFRKTFNPSLVHSLSEAYALIDAAEHIYTLGSRGSFCVAYYLGHHLNRAIGRTDIVPSDDRLGDFLHRATGRDVAILTCVPRYSRNLLTAARILYEKGTKIISINALPDSVFVQYSSVSMFAPCSSSDFRNSVMAPMLVAEMLISLVISKNRDQTLKNLDEYEKYFVALKQFNGQD